MNQLEPESGFVCNMESDCYIDTAMTDVEIVKASGFNILARGRRYGRQWLLKGLRSEFQGSTQMTRQLMKEFEIHSRLNHSGVVRAIGFEEFEGLGKCIVEEWIEGRTLADVIRNGDLAPKLRRRLIRQIIETVAYIHGKGVVHRDLKPSNIMIRNAGGEAVLIDFGLADADDYVELKRPAGTDGFISPEQRASGGARTSDDVYSLGVIMRDLCPEYGKIARRCTGPVENRPADASALLSLIDRYDRRPRILAGALLFVAVITLLGFAGARISSLQRSSQEAHDRVTVLKDSLRNVTDRMIETQHELRNIEEYNRLCETTVKEGHRRIDSVLTVYDRNIFGRMTHENAAAFTPAVNRLLDDLRQSTEDYCASLDSCGIQVHDLEQTRLDLYNYYTVTMSTYHNKWINKIFPEMTPMR